MLKAWEEKSTKSIWEFIHSAMSGVKDLPPLPPWLKKIDLNCFPGLLKFPELSRLKELKSFQFTIVVPKCSTPDLSECKLLSSVSVFEIVDLISPPDVSGLTNLEDLIFASQLPRSDLAACAEG